MNPSLLNILSKFLFIFVGYLIAFKIINYFSSEKIIFYDGLLAILIVGLAAILYQLFRNKAYIYDSIIILLIIIIFHILVPTIVDRSISVSILDDINLHPENSKEYLILSFQKNFMESNEIEKRLNEQIESGNIKITSDGTYILTCKGQITHNLFVLSKAVFATDEDIVRSSNLSLRGC
jgi:hypothetical protein|tara:strand:- start:88 stop:624 length:537 start_codon:yes stop_codon:yes gene_type:complete